MVRMCADQKVCKNTPRAWATLLPPASGIALECAARCPPDCFIQIEFNNDSSIAKESVEEGFGAPWSSHQFGKDRSAGHQTAPFERIIES